MTEVRTHRDVVRVYEPGHKGHLRFRRYLKDLWRWRSFAIETARGEIKAEHYATVLGQLWNLLHPILMAAVYVMLLTVVRGEGATEDQLAKLVLGVFVFRFISQALVSGARAVVSGDRLVLNSSVPRAVLPIASSLSSIALLLPTMVVYLVLHVVIGRPVTLALLYLPVILVLASVMVAGLALALSALTVVFRDTTNLLGHGTRYLMYMTPVIYRVEDIPESVRPVIMANPLSSFFAGLQRIVDGLAPTPLQLVAATAVAVASLVLGSWYFVRKEPAFALAIN